MATTNRDRVGRALELLTEGLKQFVAREMNARYGGKWQEQAKQSLHDHRAGKGKIQWDSHSLLGVMWSEWNEAFTRTLGAAERTLVAELRDTRNRWAHQEQFSTDDTYRALDSAERLLRAVSAADQVAEIEKQRQELLRTRFAEQQRTEVRRAVATALEGQAAGGLKPWREIVTPHPDVASGRYQQAEYCADLGQVHRKDPSCAAEYADPAEFFGRTFLTDGLRRLLVDAVQRLSKTGGAPVVELQTNFGGGKTHSLLALYHLFSGVPPADLPGVDAVLKEAGATALPKTQRVVLVGQDLSPGQPYTKPDGTVVRTLWGELAWQLDGKESHDLVREADETGTNPGEALRELLELYAPCLILIDEWVAYARQLYGKRDLPGGTFDAHFTFAQALTEAARAVPGVLLVATIPASDIEIGGEGGKAALERLKNVFGRIESPWRPASAEESFEIVRRRLFQPITDFPARDLAVTAFAELYRSQRQEFPAECRERAYQRRLEAAYPIHPELFDRLYSDWSSLDKFQRTRGVLRLMAAVIQTLWERNDSSPLILPASVPIDEPAVQFELTHYLEDQWVPVIETDVDGPNSLPLQIDGGNPNLGRYSACRRVARTIYLGSAPTLNNPNRGIEDRRIKLGCAQPGESVATFGDALRRLSGQTTYLYADGQRYWYSPVPTVTRLARDRATQQDPEQVLEEIRRRVRRQQKPRGEFARVHGCPPSAADIPDDPEARLVILDPKYPHSAKAQDSPARQEAQVILGQRSGGTRNWRNALVFLAADRTRLEEMEQAAREYLAWTSIEGEREALNLDAFQANQAKTQREQADQSVDDRLAETFQWLLVPTQPKPTGSMEWEEARLQGRDPLAVRASQKLVRDELLLIRFAGSLLRRELDRVPLWHGDYVPLKQLVEDFATYLYLPRVKSADVLAKSVQDGVSLLTWKEDGFGYAQAYDEERSRYVALVAGQGMAELPDLGGVVVKPDVAASQLAADAAEAGKQVIEGGTAVDTASTEGGVAIVQEGADQPTPPALRRFYGSVELDATRVGRDAGRIAEEIIQHLTGLVGATVRVTLEIEADIPSGAPENVVRTVTENCRVLRFEQQGFEAE